MRMLGLLLSHWAHALKGRTRTLIASQTDEMQEDAMALPLFGSSIQGFEIDTVHADHLTRLVVEVMSMLVVHPFLQALEAAKIV